MNHPKFEIDARLLTDSHTLFQWSGCHLRLHKNACLPWLIIIPITNQKEYVDLASDVQLIINHIAKVFSDLCKQSMHCDKVNFAAIGNVVDQLHVHVIGRHTKDPLWPDVVWGNELPQVDYEPKEIQSLSNTLNNALEAQA